MNKKSTLKDHLQSAEQKPEKQKNNTEAQKNSDTKENTETKPENSPELTAALEACDIWKDKAMRLQAEMENLRKRTAHDMENHMKYAQAGFAKDLLPVADCLANALDCAKKELDNAPDKTFLQNMITGIEMVQKQLDNALKKHGVEKMSALGVVFDPNLHQVISQIDSSDHPSGTIVQEMQTGYTIGGDRVLREAMVVVAK